MTTSPGPFEGQDDRLLRSASALLISNGTGAGLGVVFWVVAAHLFSAEDVGYGVAEIAAMTLLASIAQLNLGAIFPRFLWAAGAKAASVLRIGYATSILLGLAAGAAFVLLNGRRNYIEQGAFPAVLFIVAVALWVVFTIEDAALIGLRATFWVPVENTSFSVAKILLLPVFAAIAPISGVFMSWTLPVIACIIPVNYYLFRKVLPAHLKRSDGTSSLPERRVIGSILFGEYLGGLALIALGTVPALLIVRKLGAAQAAYFQTPWLVGTSFDFLLWSIATSLIVESSVRPASARGAVRKAVVLSICLLTPGLVVLVAGAHFLLGILGEAYAEHGTRLLQYLALALPFMGVNVLYVTFARLARRVRRVVGVQVALSAVIIVATALLIGPMGITGAGVAFLSGQAIVALVVLPSVVRQYRRADMAPGFAPHAALVATGERAVEDAVIESDSWAPNGPFLLSAGRTDGRDAGVDGPRNPRLPAWLSAARWRGDAKSAGTSRPGSGEPKDR